MSRHFFAKPLREKRLLLMCREMMMALSIEICGDNMDDRYMLMIRLKSELCVATTYTPTRVIHVVDWFA